MTTNSSGRRGLARLWSIPLFGTRRGLGPEGLFCFLTNAGRDYHWQDILNVICYPIDYHVSFAYEQTWMADGPTPRKGERVLIIFYDPVIEICGKLADLSEEHADLSQVSNEQFSFFPIRYATVIDPRSESGAHTFGLRLGSLVDYRGSEEEVDARIRSMQQQLLATVID